MKSLTVAVRCITGAGLLFAAQLGFAGTLAGSAHDFSTANWNPGQKVCVTCHTPHNSNTTVSAAPLWNHAVTTQVYTLYSSPTLHAAMGQPGGNSKLCLSCHDGTVAVDSFGGTVGTTNISAKNNLGGAALNDDHPIGFLYDTTLANANGSLFDPGTKTVTIGTGAQTKTGTVSAVMLFNGQMECSSCHDVHNTFAVGANGTGMVKMDTAGSKICMACHNK